MVEGVLPKLFYTPGAAAIRSVSCASRECYNYRAFSRGCSLVLERRSILEKWRSGSLFYGQAGDTRGG